MFEFKIATKSRKTRIGVLKTPHGEIETPVFMPVGTYGAVKTLAPWELEEIGNQIILSNTYHLYLRPGDQLIKKQGGLHQFMNWSQPILTDSGGFQVYSIGQRSKITEEGITFRSHIDGSLHQFTPEKSIQIQQNLGADIMMAFDDVAGVKEGRKELENSMARTHRWLERSISQWKANLKFEIRNTKFETNSKLENFKFQTQENFSQMSKVNGQMLFQESEYFDRKIGVERYKSARRASQGETKYLGRKPDGSLFGIVQGGLELDLREKSAEFIAKQDLPGNAIGGLAMPGDMSQENVKGQRSKVKGYKEQMWEVVKKVNQILPKDKPRYLMGVGEPSDLIKAINLGCDLFDCVLPTRLARHGSVWIKTADWSKLSLLCTDDDYHRLYSRINLLNSQYKTDSGPLDPNCQCPTCQPQFSRSYLRHLIVTKETLAYRLLSLHNIFFLNQLIDRVKEEIS